MFPGSRRQGARGLPSERAHMLGSFLGGQLSPKEILMRKNANSVICGQLFISDSFKIKSPWSRLSKACWLFSAIKNCVEKDSWKEQGLY